MAAVTGAATPLPFDTSALSLTEMIRLQNRLAQEVARRFERTMALAFTDIVDSTAYFARFGDVAGRALQQLHIDLLQEGLQRHEGRIVDTVGDGAFICFASPMLAAQAIRALMQRVSEHNEHRTRDHQLTLRVGLHWGRVLSDGLLVTGDTVNLTSRLAGTAEPGEIRLSRDLYQELDAAQRRLCHPVGSVEVRGARRPMELLDLDWRDHGAFPDTVMVRETQLQLSLPLRDILSFGRLDLFEGIAANDIVLALPEPADTRQISRWHFELRRRRGGYVLRSVTSQTTLVNGTLVESGQEVPIEPGAVVTLSGVVTLEFLKCGHASPLTMDRTGLVRPRSAPHPVAPASDALPEGSRPAAQLRA